MASRLSTLALATTWWLGAGAFLIPAGLQTLPTDSTSIDDSSIRTSHIVSILCAECAFTTTKESGDNDGGRDDDTLWIQGGAKDIIVNITVSESSHALEIGGAVVYPFLTSSESSSSSYTNSVVHQVQAGTSLDDVARGRVASRALEVTDDSRGVVYTEDVSDSEDKLVTLRYRILALADQPVTLRSMRISMLQSKSEGLKILDIHTRQPRDRSKWFHHSETPRLHMSSTCGILPDPICRFFYGARVTANDSKMSEGQDCGGKEKGHAVGDLDTSPHRLQESERGRKHRGHPHSLHPHGGRHHHHRHGGRFRHGILPAVFRGMVTALIPIMLGVLVGMTISLIGLALGRIIGFLWFNLVRGGYRGYASVALDDPHGYREETDPPPKYEFVAAHIEKRT